MRPFTVHSDTLQLGVADVPGELVPVVERIASALADILLEPLVDGGWIGSRCYRAFGPARIEGVGDYAGAIVDEGTVVWRGVELRVGRVA